MQVNELSNVALNWAVASASGFDSSTYMRNTHIVTDVNNNVVGVQIPINYEYVFYSPSTKWDQGGPIIERNEINIAKVGRSAEDAIAPHPECWAAHIDGLYTQYGTTPLIAAMRCFVRVKLGEDIDIPKSLI